MKYFITIVLLFVIMSIFGQETFNYNKDFKLILAKTKDKADRLSYDKLLIRFKSNDTALTDYEALALLIGFTNMPAYKPYSDLGIERAIYDLNGEGKYKAALSLADSFLRTHPLSEKALFEKAYSYHKLSNEDSAKYYVYQGQKIFSAMYFSGNGQSPDTPTFALGPADGQDYIRKFVGASIGIMGSGRDKDGNFLDILEAKPKGTTKSVNLYFIIQHATAKMFEGTELEEELKVSEEKKKSKKKKK